MSEETPEAVAGLTGARATSLERIPTRSRESAVTASSWRLSVTSAEGDGAIVLVETSASEEFFRGEGVFLGWPPERLRAAYEVLRPRSEERAMEMPQLG
ncbi:MAG: hypothetical protein ACM3SU_09045 [Acidobacteriota bacterium]